MDSSPAPGSRPPSPGRPPQPSPPLPPVLTAGAVVAGRYRLESLLARGGMSRVYVAEDLRLGRRVALKLLDATRFAEGPDREVGRERLFREAQVAASLVHPNIVEVYDVGDFDGMPFIALQLVEGEPLAGVIARHAVPALEPALETLLEIADAMAFAHARGVLHRDLKPDNVLLDARGRARVVDFGLAKVIESASTTQSGQVVGTPPYLAPELLHGDSATPASDVFSGGVLFFEYVTGRYPFSRSSLYYSIAFEEVPAPRAVRPDLPAPLEAVLLRMLAKRPDDRYGDFGEVNRDLQQVRDHLRTPDAAVADDRFLAWRANAERTHLALPFVGREVEMGALDDALKQAAAGGSPCVAVSGEAGLGKSRLVEEVRKRARLRHMGTYVGHAVETQGDYPYQMFVSLLRNWSAQHGFRTSDDLDRHVSTRAPRLRGVSPLLCGLLALAPAAARDKEQLWEAFALFLESLAAERTVVVVFEDLHAADAASLNLVRYLLLEAPRRRVAVILTHRAEGEEAAKLVTELAAAGLATTLTLRPLGSDDIAALTARLVIEPAAAPALAGLLVRESEGNPLFVAEFLKLLKAQGTLVPRGPGYVVSRDPTPTSLPAGIRAVIDRRLEKLSAPERELLDFAAVRGGGFEADELVAATGRDRLSVLRALQELERRHHLLVAEAGGGGWRFHHERVRSVVYDELTPALRGEYHALVAERLAAGAGDDLSPVLARHFEAAGRVREAAHWHRRAGAFSRRTFAFEAARDHFEKALLLEPAGERTATLEALGAVAIELRALERAEECHRELAQIGAQENRPALEAEAWRSLAHVAELRGEASHVVAHADRGLARVDEKTEPALVSHLLRIRSRGLALGGDAAGAHADVEAAVAAARNAGDVRLLAETLYWLGRGHLDALRFAEARSILDEADALARGADDPQTLVRLVAARAQLEHLEGRPREALARFEDALALAERTGSPSLRAMVQSNLAAAASELGEYARAKEVARKAAAFARRTTARRQLFASLLNLLDAQEETGDLAAARATLAEATPLAPYTDEQARDGLEFERATVLAELGQTAAAREVFEALLPCARGATAAGVRYRLGLIGLETGAPETSTWLEEGLMALAAGHERVIHGRLLAALARARIAASDLDGAGSALARIEPQALQSLSVERDASFARGLLAQAAGQRNEARVFLEAALQVARRQEARIRIVEILIAMARTEQAATGPAASAARAGEAWTLIRAVANELSSEEDRESFLRRRLFALDP